MAYKSGASAFQWATVAIAIGLIVIPEPITTAAGTTLGLGILAGNLGYTALKGK